MGGLHTKIVLYIFGCLGQKACAMSMIMLWPKEYVCTPSTANISVVTCFSVLAQVCCARALQLCYMASAQIWIPPYSVALANNSIIGTKFDI